MRLGSYRRDILPFRNVWSLNVLNGYLTERVTDAEWLTPKYHWRCLRIFTENVEFRPVHQIWSWFGLNRRQELSARFWLFYTQWNCVGYIRETISLIHGDKLELAWASVTFRLTFSPSHNFDCIIKPHVIFLITSFFEELDHWNEALRNVFFCLPRWPWY